MNTSDRPESTELQDIDALRLDLESIEEGTHHRRVALPVDWVREVLGETDASVATPGEARLEITFQLDRTVLVRGQLEIVYEVPCARCLAPAKIDVGAETGELCLTFMPKDRVRVWAELPGLASTQSQGREGSSVSDEMEIEPLEAEELDQIPYEGDVLDLRPALAEQILLTYPMRALCQRGEACRGLCQRCGFDLNGAPSDASRCPSCGAPLDGSDADEIETPWKRALSKLNRPS